jgi:hypothetical protein
MPASPTDLGVDESLSRAQGRDDELPFRVRRNGDWCAYASRRRFALFFACAS